MRRLFFIVVLLAVWIEGYAVKVETTTNLKVYYPEYTRIDLVCEEMPKTAQKDVEFCCEAAFTGEVGTTLGIEIRRERSLCFSQRAKWLPVTSLEPIGSHFINEHHIKHSIG